MENIGGGLGFAATLDIDDFNVSAEAMDRHFRQVSTNIQLEAEDMEQSLLDFAQKGAMYIQAYLVGQGMTGLLNSIVQVRGQFQQLEIAFTTMLGSEQKASQLMNQMIQTAAKTPFDLAGIAGGAKQLLAYGESAERVNDTLVRLGNIASGLSIPLNDIVYLYGTTMVQGRLYAQDVRQFTGRGIPLVKELAKMYGVTAEEINNMVSAGKIGFPEVEKVLRSMTDQGGQFYNLMEKQSASLTGMISNLEDAWDTMLNDIGTANQEFLANAINGATYMVENYQKILDILEAVAVSYGTYRAAVILNTLATKGYTGVALIDNTVRQAKITLMRAEAVATGQVAAQQQQMAAANQAYVASLEAELTAEEIAEVKKRLRIATIQSLLTAQQQEYISNLGLTTSSKNYEAVAMQVLTVDQRLAVQKLDLSSKSAVYRAALDQEVAAKRTATAATREKAAAELEAMRTEVSAAAKRMEQAKQTAVAAMQKAEAARYELYWVRQSGDASAIATAQKKLEGAQDNAAIARKNALAASTDFYTKKKTLEITATKGATVASAADTTAKGVQTAATNILSVATGRLTMMMKTLWATMKANPIGWLITIVGLLVTAFTMFRKGEEETNDVMGDFQETTKKEIDQLNLLYSILRNTEKGTKTYKDAIDKINTICKEYNKTLLDENDTLEKQREKYDDLRKAIQETTAEKVRAKYVEQAMKKSADEHAESLKTLKEAAEEAAHKEFAGYQQNYNSRGSGGSVATYKVVASKNIQQASDALWDMVEAMTQEAVQKLQGLTGEAYTNTYNEIYHNIAKAVQEGSKASGEEIEAFKPILKKYLDEYISSSNSARDEIKKIDSELGAFLAPKPVPVAESINYVEMSFADLDEKVKANQKDIDDLNAKIISPQTDTSQVDGLKTKLQELLGLQAQLNGAIKTKTENLNTDSGIQERIKQLREMISTEQYGSEQRKKHIKELQQLQSRLQANSPTSTKGKEKQANQQEQNNEQLEDKHLEAQRKLEEARIAVMEEGYAKRKATLDLQHQRELDRIDKEEKELEKARKKAGKGGLTDTDRQTFSERRNLANQSYDNESIKLFDGEIEYKKRQYEAYFNWVRNVGNDVADSHFKDLLKDGSSFMAWVNSQISQLEAKRQAQPTDFTAGDANALNALKMQMDELTGSKSGMDKFQESLTLSIRQAQTLADKLQAVADMRDRLSRGEFHLNTDESASANLELNNQESDLQNQLSQEVIDNFKSYEEKKLEITKQYQLLRNEAEKLGMSERVAMINQGENEALSALNAQMLMQNESWRNLFEDLDSLTVEQIDKLIKEIQDKMSTADMKLNPSDMKAVLDKLDEAKKKVLDTNPFRALGNALSDVFKKQQDGSKKTANQIKTDWNNLSDATKACFDFVDDAISSCSVLSDLLGETGKSVISTLSGIATAGVAMAAAIATAEKGSVILAAISIALQAISFIAGLFNNDAELEEHIQNIQRDVDKLESSLKRLKDAYDHTYWVMNDQEEAAYKKRVQAIKDQIKALEDEAELAVRLWDFKKYAVLTAQIKEMRYELEKAQRTGDMFSLYEVQVENLRKQQEMIREQIESEYDKKDSDADKISQWEEKIKDIDSEIEEMQRSMIETLAGTDVKSAIDEFADAIVEAYDKGQDAAEALGKKTKDVLRNAVIEALKRQFLAKGINEAVEYLGSAMRDNALSDTEKAHFEYLVNQAGNLFNNALNGLGDWIRNAEDNTGDALTGAIQGMSEETGSIVAGRLNAVVINQGDEITLLSEICKYIRVLIDDESMDMSNLERVYNMGERNGTNVSTEFETNQTEMMRQHLLYQAAISTNTENTVTELREIKRMVNGLANQGNPLLAQGIS